MIWIMTTYQMETTSRFLNNYHLSFLELPNNKKKTAVVVLNCKTYFQRIEIFD